MGNYPDDWERRRKRVYKRDNYRCQHCGVRGGRHGDAELHAHHKRPISEGGSHHPSNLTTLCKDCHERIHGHAVGGSTGQSSTEQLDSEVLGAIIVFVIPLGITLMWLIDGAPLVDPRILVAVILLLMIAVVVEDRLPEEDRQQFGRIGMMFVTIFSIQVVMLTVLIGSIEDLRFLTATMLFTTILATAACAPLLSETENRSLEK